jgi:phage/plasmid-like protein (TIGR03299 family)
MSEITVTTTNHQAAPRWLGRGQKVEAHTIEEVLTQGGLDWEVSKRPLATTASIPVYKDLGNSKKSINPGLMNCQGTKRHDILLQATKNFLSNQDESNLKALKEAFDLFNEPTIVPLTRDFAIVRNDNNKVLGVLGNGYTCLQNVDCLQVIETLMTTKEVTVERAGTFNDGANVWVIARIPHSIQIGPDIMDQYIRISWSHDGTEKLSATFIAHLQRSNIQISPKIPNARVSVEIRHTLNAKTRIQIAEKLFSEGRKYFDQLEEVLTELVSTPMTEKAMEIYLMTLLPDNTDEDDNATPNKHGEIRKASSRNANSRNRILEIFGDSNPDISHTKYAGLMSVMEWCDNEKSVRVTEKNKEGKTDEEGLQEDSRLQSVWRGSASKMKEKAFSMIFSD